MSPDPLPSPPPAPLAPPLGGGPPAGTAAPPEDSASAELLRAFVRGRDVPCPLCGYNLRDLTGERCPECGNGVRLQVGLTEPRLAAYITLLTACCVGLGGSALFTALALAKAPDNWWHQTSALVLLLQLAMTSVSLPLILVLRTKFRKAPAGRQRALAIGMCILVALLSALFVVSFDR